MESWNQVTLLGWINSDVSVVKSEEGQKAVFEVKTRHAYKAGASKHFEDEMHLVKIRRADTLIPYLVKGKSLHVVGRLKYAQDGKSYIQATTVNFTGARDNG